MRQAALKFLAAFITARLTQRGTPETGTARFKDNRNYKAPLTPSASWCSLYTGCPQTGSHWVPPALFVEAGTLVPFY